MDAVEPAYLERRGLSSHRVARSPNLPKLGRSQSGHLTYGAAGKVMTTLAGGLSKVSPFPLSTPGANVELFQLSCV